MDGRVGCQCALRGRAVARSAIDRVVANRLAPRPASIEEYPKKHDTARTTNVLSLGMRLDCPASYRVNSNLAASPTALRSMQLPIPADAARRKTMRHGSCALPSASVPQAGEPKS